MAMDKGILLLLGAGGLYVISQSGGASAQETKSGFSSGSGQGVDTAYILSGGRNGVGAVTSDIASKKEETASTQQLPNVIINEGKSEVYFVNTGDTGSTKKETTVSTGSGGGSYQGVPSGTAGVSDKTGGTVYNLSDGGNKKLSSTLKNYYTPPKLSFGAKIGNFIRNIPSPFGRLLG